MDIDQIIQNTILEQITTDLFPDIKRYFLSYPLFRLIMMPIEFELRMNDMKNNKEYLMVL